MDPAIRRRAAAVVAVGDELVSGLTVDTNSAWLSAELTGLGLMPVAHFVVGDDAAATVRAIRASADLARWVVVTGGLGPTPDDLTRQAAAELLAEPLAERPEALAAIAARFARMNRTMADANRVQALFPPSADMLANACGTAPGLRFTLGDADCFCLPGVPAEMREMFTRAVAPAVRAAAGGAVVAVRTLHTFGIGESDLADRLGELLARGRQPQLGTTAAGGSVSIRVFARAELAEAAGQLLDQAEAEVRDRLGPLVFGRDEETLESVIGAALRRTGRSLAVAESCTGGLLGALITSVPGSSDYFLEGVVSYANAAKVSRLGVRESTLAERGAVSEAVAAEMAAGVRAAAGADFGLSITGVAGPAGGTDEKPVGLVFVGLASPDGSVSVRRCQFIGGREAVRLRSARTALDCLRRALQA